jgi:hypothetical protein
MDTYTVADPVVVPEFQVKFQDFVPLAVEMLLDWWVM